MNCKSRIPDFGIMTYLTGILFFILCINVQFATGQQFKISPKWLFKTGDSLEWKNPGYNDNHWETLNSGLWWGHAGYDYSGFAWYRKRIFISREIKDQLTKDGYIRFSLGQIQDADETYFNGVQIGKTGNFDPFEGKWGEARFYLVKANQINWDDYNTLAIRVYGSNRNGGLHTGPYFYEPYNISCKDFLSIPRTRIIQDTLNGGIGYRFHITFRNKDNQSYPGILEYYAKSDAGLLLDSLSKRIIIPAKGEFSDSFVYRSSENHPSIFKLVAKFTESRSMIALSKEYTMSTLKEIHLPVQPVPDQKGTCKVLDGYQPVAFGNIVMGGYLGDRIERNLVNRLLNVDEQEILAGYVDRPGKQNWVGEHIGKYFDAACNSWSYSHNPDLKMQMDRMLYILLRTQKENGYLGTYGPDHYWTNWDVWSHKYNLVGLLAYFKATGYQPALDAAVRIGDLLCETFGPEPGKMDIINSGTHVGMASTSVLDPVTDLYLYTGNSKYLDFACYIVRAYNHEGGPGIVNSLLRHGLVSKVANGKAYEMLSNLVGLLKLYRITGQDMLFQAACIAWEDIVKNRLYITGTTSAHELFRENHVLPAGENDQMGEGCVTTTWLQFNDQLFKLTGEIKYFEEIEKTVYNHLLAAQNPITGCVSYYTPLMGKKPHSCQLTCCLSSIPRGISLIPSLMYGKRSGIPSILLYDSMEVKDTVYSSSGNKIPIELSLRSLFPDSGFIECTINPGLTDTFPLSFRVPQWAKNYWICTKDSEFHGSSGEWLILRKKWSPGEKFTIAFDIPVQVIDGDLSYPGYHALKRGPQVLTMDEALNPDIKNEFVISGLCTHKIFLEKSHSLLSPLWFGKQAYTLIPDKAGIKKIPIVLVPYAEAGQNGSESKVWFLPDH